MQASGDHQVEHKPQIVVEPDGDSLANTLKRAHRTSESLLEWWFRGSQQKGTS